VWPIGEPLEAHCLSEYMTHHNGIHAFKRQHTIAEYRASYSVNGDPPLVYGTVALWGRVIEHQEGYRAEFAYPQSLVVPAGTKDAQALARALANTYGIDVRVESAP
jgi:hypothetical protein